MMCAGTRCIVSSSTNPRNESLTRLIHTFYLYFVDVCNNLIKIYDPVWLEGMITITISQSIPSAAATHSRIIQ